MIISGTGSSNILILYYSAKQRFAAKYKLLCYLAPPPKRRPQADNYVTPVFFYALSFHQLLRGPVRPELTAEGQSHLKVIHAHFHSSKLALPKYNTASTARLQSFCCLIVPQKVMRPFFPAREAKLLKNKNFPAIFLTEIQYFTLFFSCLRASKDYNRS